MMLDLIMSCKTVSNLVYASLFEQNFVNKLGKTNFKFYCNSLIFLNLGICSQIKICPGFFALFIFLGITVEIALN